MDEPFADLYSFLRTLAPIEANDFRDFSEGLRQTRYEKGDLFTRIGDETDKVGFVEAGVFRVYYLSAEGEMRIRNFCGEGEPIGSYATILTGQAAHVNIEAMESSSVIETSYAHLSRFFERGKAWERLGRRIAELHYISREKREFQLLSFDAKERYELFLRDFPGLESRITQANIASYLGISPVSLSRIRSQRLKKSSKSTF